MISNNPFEALPQQTNATSQNFTQGLIGGAMPQQQAQSYNPATRTVDTKQTAQGQVNSILAQDNPLMQRARSMALQQMNRRGLINSSMAVGAGQAAMMDYALPLAQQDASTYAQAESQNLEAINQASQFNVGERNKFGLQLGQQQWATGERLGSQAYGTSERLGGQAFARGERLGSQQFQTGERVGTQQFQTGERVAGQTFVAGQSALDRQQQMLLQSAQQKWQTGERLSAQEYDALQQAASRQWQTGERVGTQQFEAGQQTAAQEFQAQQQVLQNKWASGERLSTQDFQALQQANQNVFAAQQSHLDRAQQTLIQNLQQSWATGERLGSQDYQNLQASLQRDFTANQASLDRTQQSLLLSAQQKFASGQQLTEQEFQATQSSLQRSFLADQQEMQNQFAWKTQTEQNAFTLEQMGYQLQLQNAQVPSNFAAGISSQTLQVVQQLQADPNLDAAAKKTAIANAVNYANSTLSWASKFYGAQIPNLTVPGGATSSFMSSPFSTLFGMMPKLGSTFA